MPTAVKHLETGVTVVAVSGRLTMGREVERLEAVVNDLLKQNDRKFVFDLGALDYADSSGIGTVVSCLTWIKKSGGELRIAGASPRIQRMFKMTGVDTLMAMYPSVAEAAGA